MRIPYMSPRLRCALLLSTCFVLNGLPHTVMVAAGRTMEEVNKDAQKASAAADKILKAAKEKVESAGLNIKKGKHFWSASEKFPAEQTNAFSQLLPAKAGRLDNACKAD